ncbi:hypothetical protein Hanom_Chr07g00599441 [Helianthus anomalus]
MCLCHRLKARFYDFGACLAVYGSAVPSILCRRCIARLNCTYTMSFKRLRVFSEADIRGQKELLKKTKKNKYTLNWINN